jgi:hypothetical protein
MADALLALVLIVASVFVSLAFFRSQVRELRGTQDEFNALLIAESEIERLHTLSWDRIPLGEAQQLALALPSAAHLKESAATLSVKELEPGLKRAEVRVEWSSSTGRRLHVEQAEEFAREALRP